MKRSANSPASRVAPLRPSVTVLLGELLAWLLVTNRPVVAERPLPLELLLPGLLPLGLLPLELLAFLTTCATSDLDPTAPGPLGTNPGNPRGSGGLHGGNLLLRLLQTLVRQALHVGRVHQPAQGRPHGVELPPTGKLRHPLPGGPDHRPSLRRRQPALDLPYTSRFFRHVLPPFRTGPEGYSQ